MNAIDVAERQAIASPRDWPNDFVAHTTWNVCSDCVKAFLGRPNRIQCRVCAETHEVRK